MSELTQEISERLSAPVPESAIGHKNKGGQDLRFTSDKWVFDRLDEVVGNGNWEDHYTANETSVTCHLTVLGVTKGAVADHEEGKYGGPNERAQAKALKRAAMKFGIARELWDKEDAPPASQPQRPTPIRNAQPSRPAPTQSYNNNDKPVVSERQRELLLQLHVPSELIAMLSKKDLMSADYNGKDLIGILKRRKPANRRAAEEIVEQVTGHSLGESGDDLLDDTYPFGIREEDN